MAVPLWPAVVDDSGPGTDGTLFSAAYNDALEDAVEGITSGASNPLVVASEIIDEVVDARDGEADLTTKLESIEAGQSGVVNPGVIASDIIDEVVEARASYLSLDERFDNLANANDIQEFGAAQKGVMGLGAQEVPGLKTFRLQPQGYGGTATTLPFTVGGNFVKDVAAHNVIASQTDSVMTDTEIPANMLNADGKTVELAFGTSTAETGAAAHTIELDIAGTQTTVKSGAAAQTSWQVRALIIRIDSDSVDLVVRTWLEGSNAEQSKVVRINGLDFTAAIDVRTLATTGAGSTTSQTYFLGSLVG